MNISPKHCRQAGTPDTVSYLPMWVCLFGFNILATSKAISGWVPTYDSAHSRQLNSAAPLGDRATDTMTQFPTHSLYIELTSHCPILLMPSARLGGDKHQFYKAGFELPTFCLIYSVSVSGNPHLGVGTDRLVCGKRE